MRQSVPNYLDPLVTTTRDAFCDILHDPSLWSEKMIQQTLSRLGGTPFNIEDVQNIVKDYLTVLADNIRRGESLT